MKLTFEQACIERLKENKQVMALLPKAVFKRELSLSFRRWSGYIFESPLESTVRFAADYRDAYFRTYGMRCGSFDCVPGTPEFLTIWEMRQSADYWALPYPLYLDVCFGFYRKKDPKKLYSPSLTFAKREETPSWKKKYRETVAERFVQMLGRAAALPQFRAEHYCSLPAQNRFRGLVTREAEKKGRWTHFLEVFFVHFHAISAKQLLSRLTDSDTRAEVIESVRISVNTGTAMRQPLEDIGPASLLQSCFGMAYRGMTGNQACRTCPHRAPCLSATMVLLDPASNYTA